MNSIMTLSVNVTKDGDLYTRFNQAIKNEEYIHGKKLTKSQMMKRLLDLYDKYVPKID